MEITIVKFRHSAIFIQVKKVYFCGGMAAVGATRTDNHTPRSQPIVHRASHRAIRVYRRGQSAHSASPIRRVRRHSEHCASPVGGSPPHPSSSARQPPVLPSTLHLVNTPTLKKRRVNTCKSPCLFLNLQLHLHVIDGDHSRKCSRPTSHMYSTIRANGRRQ